MDKGHEEGLVCGRYRVTGWLGRGGMAEVYTATHDLMKREAAVKVLLPRMSSRHMVVKRFLQEARATAAIKHPGIVEIYDVGFTADGRAYIVMEKLEGETLKTRLDRQGVLAIDEARTLIRQLAGAMDAAHARGIVHRDLKPGNLFIVRDPEVSGGERVKVLDFGIAKLAAEHAGSVVTAESAVFGTPAYMAPEQCESAARVDGRADLYSIGCIFYRCVTGETPFQAAKAYELLEVQQTRDPEPPSRRRPEVPPDLDAIILSLLARSPDDRVQTGADLIAMLGGDPNADDMTVVDSATEALTLAHGDPEATSLEVPQRDVREPDDTEAATVAAAAWPGDDALAAVADDAETRLDQAAAVVAGAAAGQVPRPPHPSGPYPAQAAGQVPRPPHPSGPYSAGAPADDPSGARLASGSWPRTSTASGTWPPTAGQPIDVVSLPGAPGGAYRGLGALRWSPRTIAVACLVLVLVVVVWALPDTGQVPTPAAVPTTEQPALSDDAARMIEQHLDRVRTALDERAWERALEAAARAGDAIDASAGPAAESYATTLAALRERALAGQRHRAAFQQFQDALLAGDGAEAAARFAEIPPDSAYRADAEHALERALPRLLGTAAERARALAEQGECDALEAWIREIEPIAPRVRARVQPSLAACAAAP